MEPLRIAAIGSWVVGGSIAVVALVAILRSIRDVRTRLRSLGFAYLGFFVAIVGGLLYGLALMGEERLPLFPGIPALFLVGFTALRMRAAAARAFADAKKAEAG